MNAEYDCKRCRATCTTDDGCEPTEYCHHCAQAMVADATVLEEYPESGDGKRVWALHAQTWLYPGDKILVINTNKPR